MPLQSLSYVILSSILAPYPPIENSIAPRTSTSIRIASRDGQVATSCRHFRLSVTTPCAVTNYLGWWCQLPFCHFAVHQRGCNKEMNAMIPRVVRNSGGASCLLSRQKLLLAREVGWAYILWFAERSETVCEREGMKWFDREQDHIERETCNYMHLLVKWHGFLLHLWYIISLDTVLLIASSYGIRENPRAEG